MHDGSIQEFIVKKKNDIAVLVVDPQSPTNGLL